MSENQVKICQFCGGEINEDAKKCKFCGEWVISEENELPQELKHFNWGAFLFNWIWGIMHKKYITLLYFVACLIPVIGPIGISVWFGVAGNKWAWQSKNWDSIEQFNETQRNWVKLWLILAVVSVILAIKIFIILTLIGSYQV